MNQNQPDDPAPDPIDQDAEALESKYGPLASTYAETRAEAARLRGADAAADHWLEVEEQVENADQNRPPDGA